MTLLFPLKSSFIIKLYAESDTASGMKNMYSAIEEYLLLRLVSDAARRVKNVLSGTKRSTKTMVFFSAFRNAGSEKSIL